MPRTETVYQLAGRRGGRNRAATMPAALASAIGRAGALARAANLSPARRSEIARRAGLASGVKRRLTLELDR